MDRKSVPCLPASLQVCSQCLLHTILLVSSIFQSLAVFVQVQVKKKNKHTQISREMGRPCGDMIHIYAMKEEINIYAV